MYGTQVRKNGNVLDKKHDVNLYTFPIGNERKCYGLQITSSALTCSSTPGDVGNPGNSENTWGTVINVNHAKSGSYPVKAFTFGRSFNTWRVPDCVCPLG